MSTAMGLQCYGASRMQDGGTANEDAFWINRPHGDVAVVCDGAGRAQRCAASVATHFSRHLASGAMDVSRFPAWRTWLTAMDATLLGGPQTTFVGVAMREGHLYGACAGNSRAYLMGESGVRILTEDSSPRLGSGRAQPTAIHERLAPRDVVLLMSDGAWTPLSMAAIQRCVVASAMKHPSDLPPALLDVAGARGRGDDITVVTLTARGQ